MSYACHTPETDSDWVCASPSNPPVQHRSAKRALPKAFSSEEKMPPQTASPEAADAWAQDGFLDSRLTSISRAELWPVF